MRVAQAGDVKVATTGGFAVLQPNFFGRGVGHVQAVFVWSHAWLLCQPCGQVHHDVPIVSCLARWRHSGMHAGDAAFAVGDGAFFLAPGGGG